MPASTMRGSPPFFTLGKRSTPTPPSCPRSSRRGGSGASSKPGSCATGPTTS
jgi:hypothetical protein